jgi:GNAT superfamily N-acetyltransferase/predicted double-glycine peptidase
MKYIKLFEQYKLSLLNQTKDYNCGPTALKMIADYYKISVSLEELEIIMGSDNITGTTDIKMLKGLEYLSLDYKQFTSNKQDSYNMLHLTLKNNVVLLRTLIKNIKHWICCDKYDDIKKTYHILDPWLGEYTITESELETIWSARNYDGFIINGIKKISLGEIKIQSIQKIDMKEILNMCSCIFTNVMNYTEIQRYLIATTDFEKSFKLTDNNKIIGCYLINEITLPELPNKIGLEGIALAIIPSYRKYGLGEKLKDYLEQYGKDNNYDFIFGEHLKGLNNINDWLKRRELYKETESSYFTIKYLN